MPLPLRGSTVEEDAAIQPNCCGDLGPSDHNFSKGNEETHKNLSRLVKTLVRLVPFKVLLDYRRGNNI